MKTYTVYFGYQKYGVCTLTSETVEAANKKEAFSAVEAICRRKFDRHAFYKTTTPPEVRETVTVNRFGNVRRNERFFFNGTLWAYSCPATGVLYRCSSKYGWT